ncbi:Uma2 family endonuclease [Streptomyces sp. NBC_00829]|uniref:Uma2 family endonuclease n=1 Tax=Streptomyces sp. NBC_00829 TaxID=2903679 RepID=UPI0038689DAD
MSVASIDHTGPWTMADVLALPEDTRNRIELVGGALVMSPSPGIAHQRASPRLAAMLDAAIEAAQAPLEVLEAVNVAMPDGLLIPDIAVMDATASAEAGLTIHADDVLIVVEIASPSTRRAAPRRKPGRGPVHQRRAPRVRPVATRPEQLASPGPQMAWGSLT